EFIDATGQGNKLFILGGLLEGFHSHIHYTCGTGLDVVETALASNSGHSFGMRSFNAAAALVSICWDGSGSSTARAMEIAPTRTLRVRTASRSPTSRSALSMRSASTARHSCTWWV